MTKQPDVIIVGSGPGGATAASVLCRRGMHAVILEKGPARPAEDFLPYDEIHFLEHKALHPHAQDADGKPLDPDVYIDPTGRRTLSERWWHADMVGGATNLWEANLPRYTSEDFSVLDYLESPTDTGVSMVNWPWRYEEWHPYFEQAEWEWGVSGQVGQCRAQEPTRNGYNFPMPPLRPHAQVSFIREVFQRVGFNPYLSPRGINSRTYNGRPGCPFCGFCQGFGCAVNDRATSQNTVLPIAISTGRCEVRTGHCVTRILFDKRPGKRHPQVRGVEYKTEPNGKTHVLDAPRVIVSVQAIQSARLFLLSDVPNPNDLIGRYLTYHTKGSLDLTFPHQGAWGSYRTDSLFQPKTSLGSLQLRDLYVIRDSATHLTKGGKFSIYDPYTINPPIKAIAGTGLWGRRLLDRLCELRSCGGVSFSFTGEAISRHDNFVDLDDQVKDPWGIPVARTHYKHHDYDIALSDYVLKRLRGILEDAGGQVRRFSPQGLANAGYGHNHGTLRAGTDSDESVLDSNCQSWQVAGLHVLDSAWMPTSGASNPTLTQIANAYRVCHQMQ